MKPSLTHLYHTTFHNLNQERKINLSNNRKKHLLDQTTKQVHYNDIRHFIIHLKRWLQVKNKTQELGINMNSETIVLKWKWSLAKKCKIKLLHLSTFTMTEHKCTNGLRQWVIIYIKTL